MGATCMAVNCVGSYCFCYAEDYQGNKIFQKINTNLNLENEQLSEESKRSLEQCEQLLKESEGQRQKIADKFKELLVDTGACVINKPTLERAAITYIIYTFSLIMRSARERKVDFDKSDFNLSNFISITKTSPFVTLNQIAIDKIKNKYGFDMNTTEQISKGKTSLINFLSTAFGTQAVFSRQYEVIKRLLLGLDYKHLKKLKDSLEGISFIFNYYTELTSSIISIHSQLANPRKIELFYKIANDASQKDIKDPKEFALRYSYGETCGSIDNWEENIGYKKIEILKY